MTPKAFRNTELIYSDAIGEMVYEMGFKTMLTEGAKHVLGWKSPNFVYTGATAPKLKLLLKNSGLSDDIAFRFSDRSWSEWPLTGEKYLSWLKSSTQNEEIVNLFMDYETFGEHQKAASGIFDFMKFFPEVVLKDGEFEFVTPSQAAKKHRPVAEFDVPDPISWEENIQLNDHHLSDPSPAESLNIESRWRSLFSFLPLLRCSSLTDDLCNCPEQPSL